MNDCFWVAKAHTIETGCEDSEVYVPDLTTLSFIRTDLNMNLHESALGDFRLLTSWDSDPTQYKILAIGGFEEQLNSIQGVTVQLSNDLGEAAVRIYEPNQTLEWLTYKGKDGSDYHAILIGGWQATQTGGDIYVSFSVFYNEEMILTTRDTPLILAMSLN